MKTHSPFAALRRALAQARSGGNRPSRDPAWILAQKKRQAERALRAEGNSRSEATRIAAQLFRKP